MTMKNYATMNAATYLLRRTSMRYAKEPAHVKASIIGTSTKKGPISPFSGESPTASKAIFRAGGAVVNHAKKKCIIVRTMRAVYANDAKR
jgi:hypothetical protein